MIKVRMKNYTLILTEKQQNYQYYLDKYILYIYIYYRLRNHYKKSEVFN